MEKLDYLRLDNLLLLIAKIQNWAKNKPKKNINREGFKDQNHFHVSIAFLFFYEI